MTFTLNIPASGQSLGSSRTQVLGNFTNYKNLVSVDHVDPNDPNQGQHKQVTFNDIGDFASYVTASNFSYLYSILGSTAGTNLVYQPSVVTQPTKVPGTVRAICRVKQVASVWSLSADGPYGANSTFNIGSVTSVDANNFTVPFSASLADANYFVMYSIEGTGISNDNIVILNKTNAQFSVKLGASANITNICFMVY